VTVFVGDTTAPNIIQCAGNQTVQANAQCQGVLPDLRGQVVATDNCDASPTVSQSPAPGFTFSQQQMIVTFTVTDDSSNQSQCSCTVTRQDVTNPVVVCPPPAVVIGDANCQALMPDLISSAQISDNCGIQGVQQEPPAGTLIDEGLHNVTITATDTSGNPAACQTSVTVQCPVTPVLYVDADATGSGNGSSWCNAYTSLQQAMLAAAGSGGTVTEIRVAQGTYKPAGAGGSRTASFVLIGGVSLRGGYAGCGQPDPDAHNPSLYITTLSGDLNNDDGPGFANYGDNSYHVITAPAGIGDGTVLDGFTITAGNANGPPLSPTDRGAGMYVEGSPMITQCMFLRNRAGLSGGAGMFIQQAVPGPIVENCVFFDNLGGYGAAVNIIGNPGMINAVAPQFHTCRFLGNHAMNSGGAIASDRCAARFANCLIAGNAGQLGAGAVSNNGVPQFTNCTIVGNNTANANSSGGLHTAETQASPALYNCILWANGAAGNMNQAAQIRVTSGNLIVAHSCVHGWTGSLGGIGNHGTDPRLVDPDGPDGILGTLDDNGRLAGGSTSIDSGSNPDALPAVPFDLYGNPRIVDDPGTPDTGVPGSPGVGSAIVDRGAHEFHTTTVPGDVTGDGQVNADDLVEVILQWGTCPAPPTPCPGDVNHSGAVDSDDLVIVILNWT
jgi:predicted outer membrane repeat protein